MYAASAGLGVLREALSWVHVLVALAGVVVCAVNLRRSRWTWVLLCGFGVDAFVSTAYRVSSLLIGGSTLAYEQLGALFLLLSFLGVVGAAAIVGGLAMLLREVGASKRP
jgi:hypothetical protein